jgi:putative transcriptional regulator
MRNRVKELREGLGLSQGALGGALRTPVSRQTINALERGRYDNPSLQLALDLAHYFGKPVEEIFYVDDH